QPIAVSIPSIGCIIGVFILVSKRVVSAVTALLPGLLFIFYFVPVIFVIWFMVTIVGQLKAQTKLLKQIHEKVKIPE
ncbi:hypothetical protein, partial [Psychrobacillus psychrotolerans]|uniref:hypothetical protein n=1 Tax=Psychrobacillus psychrotolerans TaxID=126156 RepID=UPI003314C0EE